MTETPATNLLARLQQMNPDERKRLDEQLQRPVKRPPPKPVTSKVPKDRDH